MLRLFPVALVALVALVGCSDGPNKQYLPIGSYCTSDGECGTEPFECLLDEHHPGGYCQRQCSTTSNSCPASNSVCVPALGECRRKCPSADYCRASEGYTCVQAEGLPSYCDHP